MRLLLRFHQISLALVAASTAASAQAHSDSGLAPSPAPVDTGAMLLADTAVTMGTLPNGLRYYLRVNQEPAKRAELRLIVRAGSLQEEESQRGLAHFVEHMAFNGTKNFAKQEVIRYFESIGMQFGGDLNASTTFDHTLYRLTVPTDAPGALEKGLQILDDWASAITFDEKEFEGERGVVLAEWRARLGAGARVREHTDSVLYGKSRYLDRMPIGVPERIEKAPRSELVRFYKDWYRPDLIAVVVTGAIDKAATEELIKRQFGDIATVRSPRPREGYTIPDHGNVLVSIVTDPELTGSGIQLIRKFRPAPVNSTQRARAEITQTIFSSILNHRLREVATRSNAPFLGASTGFSSFVGGMHVQTVVSVSVRDDALRSGLHAALSEVERIVRHGITAEELDREKRAARSRYTQAMITRSKITSASYAATLVSHFLSNRTPGTVESSVAQGRALLEQVTREEVAELAAQWKNRENVVLIATLPQRDGVLPPTAEELLAVLDEVQRAPIDARQAGAVAEAAAPLMPTLPTPGAIVKERSHPEVGITEWTLANGARVLLKPTTFTPDQVLLSGYSWGGTSVLADDRLLDATLARVLPALSGLGTFSSTELRNAIVGKILTVGLGLGNYNQTVSGNSTVRDLEAFLQLVHLHFTAPRADEEAIRAWQERTKTALEGRTASPEAHFADTLTAILSQRHARNRFLTPAAIDSIDPTKALAIYRERFGEASDFTFVLVGAFTPDSIRGLVERYLGGLPSGKGGRGWRDNGLRAPSGVVEKEFRFGREPRARTSIVFNGPFVHSEDEQYALGAMTSVLTARLRERLRETLAGTYSVSVAPEIRSIPERSYSIRITFDAAPERDVEMRKAVFDEIEALRRKAPTAEEVAKVREESARQLELSLKSNAFWLQVIGAYDQMQRPLPELAHYGDSLKKVQASTIQEMARQYLNLSRFVRVTQMPAQ